MTPALVVISEDDPHLNTEVAGEHTSRVVAREPQVYDKTPRSCLLSVFCLSRNFATFSATSAARGKSSGSHRGLRSFLRDFALGEVLS